MSDIIKRLEDANGELLMVGNDFSDPLLDAAKEIKSLRQQVEYWRDTVRQELITDYEKQLAALKQLFTDAAFNQRSQGEPVARIIGTKENGHRKWFVKPYDALYKVPSQDEYPWHVSVDVYTAPTIPEGWQVVPINPTPAMIEEGYAQAWIRNPSNFGDKDAIFVYKAMLNSAPKVKE